MNYEDAWNKVKWMLMDNYLIRNEEYLKSKSDDDRLRSLIYSEILTIMNLIEEEKG